MIKLFIISFFVIIIILFFKNIQNIHKYNANSKLIKIDNIKLLKQNKKILDPILLEYNINVNIDYNNILSNNIYNIYKQHDIDIRLIDFNYYNNLYIFNNEKLIKDIKLIDNIKEIHDIFKLNTSINAKYSCSIFKGINNINLIKCKNDITLISCIEGKCNIYLYNPKHKNDIQINKKNYKCAINVNLNKDNTLYIPPNWYYDIETQNDCKLLHAYSDTYFTSIYNIFRN